MPLTIDQLLRTPTKEALRASLLTELQGIGFTTQALYSAGTVTLSGVPAAAVSWRVKIIASGQLGTATYQYSVDGGTSYSSTLTVPSGGTYAVPTTDINIVFANGPSGITSSFLIADVFSVETRVPVYPATSWQTGSLPLTLVENDAAVMEDVYALVNKLGRSGFLSTALKDWLDLWAGEVYDFTRRIGVVTKGYIHLTDPASQGPFTITNNQLWFISNDGKRYNSVGTYTLTLGGTVDVLVQAERAGSTYNVPNATIVQFVTPLPSVVVNNPVYANGTWITQQGTDDETDAAFVTRCKARWPALGTGLTAQVYDLFAKTASASVTRTKVIADPVTAGQVDIYLAGPSGPSGAATAVAAYILPRLPLTVTQLVADATATVVTVTATVYVATALQTQAAIDIAANLGALFGGGTSTTGEVLPGFDIAGTVYLSQIIEQIQVVNGVRNSTIVAPVADVVLAAGHVATATLAISIVAV